MTSSRRSGFTLVELLIAMAIFSIVISVATGAFIRALRTQRQLVSFASANSNLSLVLEQMAREIRVGSSFQQDGEGNISFVNGRGDAVTYAYDEEREAIERVGPTGEEQPLTSENVAVKDLRFLVLFGAEDDGYPARVTVTAAVTPREAGVDTAVIRIQTTISARSLGT